MVLEKARQQKFNRASPKITYVDGIPDKKLQENLVKEIEEKVREKLS